MLLYIDRKRTGVDELREEYAVRMNKDILDALKVGIPAAYIDKGMR